MMKTTEVTKPAPFISVFDYPTITVAENMCSPLEETITLSIDEDGVWLHQGQQCIFMHNNVLNSVADIVAKQRNKTL